MKYKISLRIIDEELDPSIITNILNIEPTVAYKKGDINYKITRNGQISTFRNGAWILGIPSEKDKGFVYHLKLLFDQLEPVWKGLIEISKRGYKMDVFCGVFSNKGEQTGIEISASAIKKISELNIPIGICFYRMLKSEEL